MMKSKKTWRRTALLAAALLLSTTILGTVTGNFPVYGENLGQQEQRDMIPQPVSFVNGSFEDPGGFDGWRYFDSEDVPGWNTRPVGESDESSPNAYKIELQKADPTNPSYASQAAEGDYYAEINADVVSYLYQLCNTTPGTRLYYSFYHRGRGSSDGQDVMDFFLQTPGEQTQAVLRCQDSVFEWGHYSGQYIVPEGQTITEFGFQSVSSASESAVVGNLLDDVSLVTGAWLKVEKTCDADERLSRYGDRVRYTITVTNYGELSASQVVLTDRLEEHLQFAGNVTVNGEPSYPVVLEEPSGLLSLELPNIAGVRDRNEKMGQTLTISYDAVLRNPGDGLSGTVIQNQASVHYNDGGYEMMPENENGYTSYSNIHQLPVFEPIATTSVAVQKVWKGSEDPDRPAEIQVQLYRNGHQEGEPAVLTEEGEWRHVWKDLITWDPAASPSDAAETINWTVEEISQLPAGYTSTVNKLDDNTFVIENLFRKPVPDSSGSTEIFRPSVPNQDQEEHLEVKKTILSGLPNPGETITYQIVASNEGNTVLQGVRIRDYVPLYTSYQSCDELGHYGVINGQEHVTWFLSELKPGESQILTMSVTVNGCIGGAITNSALYEVTGSLKAPPVNDPKDPGNGSIPAGFSENYTSNFEKQESNIRVILNARAVATSEVGLPKTGEEDNSVVWWLLGGLFLLHQIFILFRRKIWQKIRN